MTKKEFELLKNGDVFRYTTGKVWTIRRILGRNYMYDSFHTEVLESNLGDTKVSASVEFEWFGDCSLVHEYQLKTEFDNE